MTTGRINQVTKPSSGNGTQAPVHPRRGRKRPGLDVLWSPGTKAFLLDRLTNANSHGGAGPEKKISGPALRRGGTSRKAVTHARQLLPSPRAGKRCNLRQRRRDTDRVRTCKGLSLFSPLCFRAQALGRAVTAASTRGSCTQAGRPGQVSLSL